MSKNQIVHIHGGTPFDSREQYESYISRFYDPLKEKKSWPEWLKESLENEAEVLLPKMPAKDNADYAIWKIAFEKMIPFFTDENLIFTTRSLGTTFLTKYFSENIFPRPIKALHLVALVFDGEGVPDEGMADFVIDAEKGHNTQNQIDEIHLWHSTDDFGYPEKELVSYQKHFPNALLHQFTDRGHFGQPEFPELLEQLKKEIN